MSLELQLQVIETQLSKYQAARYLMLRLLLGTIRDTRYPLDERWEMYLRYGECLPISPYYFDLEGIIWDRYSFPEYFYCDRYDVITVDEMYMCITQSPEKFLEVDMRKFKESWMQESMWGFKYDW